MLHCQFATQMGRLVGRAEAEHETVLRLRFVEGTVQQAEPEHETDFEINVNKAEVNLHRIVEDAWDLFPFKTYTMEFTTLLSLQPNPIGVMLMYTMAQVSGPTTPSDLDAVNRILNHGLDTPIQIIETDMEMKLNPISRDAFRHLVLARAWNPEQFKARFRDDHVNIQVNADVTRTPHETAVHVG